MPAVAAVFLFVCGLVLILKVSGEKALLPELGPLQGKTNKIPFGGGFFNTPEGHGFCHPLSVVTDFSILHCLDNKKKISFISAHRGEQVVCLHEENPLALATVDMPR